MIDPELSAWLSRIEAKLDRTLDPDGETLRVLLPAIYAVTEGATFLAADLEGEIDLGGLSQQQLGKLLHRARIRRDMLYRVSTHGKQHAATVWKITLADSAK